MAPSAVLPNAIKKPKYRFVKAAGSGMFKLIPVPSSPSHLPPMEPKQLGLGLSCGGGLSASSTDSDECRSTATSRRSFIVRLRIRPQPQRNERFRSVAEEKEEERKRRLSNSADSQQQQMSDEGDEAVKYSVLLHHLTCANVERGSGTPEVTVITCIVSRAF